ncbi:MAG: bifunctional chorismate mutase/prephenate dehydratase, partial [Ruminococcus sp.]|nr:bifunctional chorismate mutase/prephenate dehydratase [Ruminococcus sp.]
GEVFAAVQSGNADFGVVPITNSTAGTVTQTYELMRMYDFCICATTKVRANHVLCVKQKTDPKDITRVYSHEQALMQCSNYLSAHGYSTRPYENTALAASFVKESDKPYAAICSDFSAKHWGLKIVDTNIANAESNFTRFILISKELRLADGADTISVALRLPHQTSALYRLLTKFSVAGLNLTKLESRPIANTDFDVLFYLDFEGSINSPDVIKLIRELETELSYMKFLGNYKEV